MTDVTFHTWAVALEERSSTVHTHESSAGVAERRPFVRGFMEVMCVVEVVTELCTYGHPPHEVRGDFFPADLSLPGRDHNPRKGERRVSQSLCSVSVRSCVFCPEGGRGERPSCITCQFRECRRRKGSWLLFSQSLPAKCSRPGSGRSFSLWTTGGNRAI